VEEIMKITDYFQSGYFYRPVADYFYIENTRCIKDIGPWKAGDVLEVLCMDYRDAKLTEYNDEGKEIKSAKIMMELK
jgi:hypothetical protein